jgi:hypothetical protein
MIRERVAESVYVFTSERYASVNAGAVIGPDWSVLIDTLPFPDETQEMRDFIQDDLESDVRYIIYTHYHADHTFGACWFPDAFVLSHANTAKLLDTRGREGLERAKSENRALREVELKLPDFVFEQGSLGLRLGERTMELVPLPVWKTSTGKCSSCSPAATSRAACSIASAFFSSRRSSRRFTRAQASLTKPSACTKRAGIGSPLTGKFSTARCVEAP